MAGPLLTLLGCALLGAPAIGGVIEAPPAAAETEDPHVATGDADDDGQDGGDVENTDSRAVVVGSLFGRPDGIPRIVGSAHAIGEDEIEAGEHDDVHKLLLFVPGVYVRGEDG